MAASIVLPTASGRRVALDQLAPWLARARTLDAEAWDVLYQLAFPHVYRYVAARVPSQQEAEDLTEEVFLGALQSAASLRANDESSFLAWLYQIARHKLTDRLRRQYRKPTEPLADDLEVVDPDRTPEEQAVAVDTARTLRVALDALTPEQQDVIVMKFVMEYDNAQAAAVLKRSTGAINQLQHRALAQLRRLIRKAEGGDDG